MPIIHDDWPERPESTRIAIRCTACRETPGRGPAGLCSVCRGSAIERLTVAEIEQRLVEKPGKFLYIGIPIHSDRHLDDVCRSLGLWAQGDGSSSFGSSSEGGKPAREPLPPLPRPQMYTPTRELLGDAKTLLGTLAQEQVLFVLRRPPLLVGAAGRPSSSAPPAAPPRRRRRRAGNPAQGSRPTGDLRPGL